MKKVIIIFNLSFLILNSFCFAQQNKIDSLLTLLKTDKEDTNKVIHLYNLCRGYELISEYDKGLAMGKQALTLAQNLGFKKGVGNAYNNIGNIYTHQGNYPEALKSYFASLKIKEETEDKIGIANCYNNIGNTYMYQGNYSEALKNQLTSLKINEEIKNKQGIAYSYNNIGNIYYNQRNYPEALTNYFAGLKIREEIKDKQGIAYSYCNIGNVYYDKNNLPEALTNYLASEKIFEEIGDRQGLTATYGNIGQLYLILNKTKEAQIYLSKALTLGIKIGSKDIVKNTYGEMASLDSTMGNYKAAFEHHKLYILYRDSLYNEETQKKSLQASMQYEFDKKEIAAKAEQDKLDAINTEEKKKQQIVIYAVAGLLILVGVFAVFMYNRFRITQKQKQVIEEQKILVDKAYEELHEKNKEVMDSIHYAKRIQTALITSEKSIEIALKKLMNNN